MAPSLLVTGWLTWAYLRTRPPSFLTTGAHPLRRYDAWAYRAAAYSDVVALYRVHHLAAHAAPYIHNVIEYPVLTGLFMWAMAFFPGIGGYFLASSLGLWIATVACTYVLWRAKPRLAWAFALCPMLLVYSLLNWDLLAIALMLLGWHFARERRPALAGALYSLGVFAKLFPIVLLVYELIALCFARDDPRARRSARRMAFAAVAVGVVVNLPFAALNLKGWNHFLAFNAARSGGGGLLYELRLAQHWSIGTVDVVSALLALVAVVLAAWALRRGASLEFAAAAVFTFIILINKTYSPQYALWVFVYALLAEWPLWSLAVLTGAGLIDFANATVTLHLALSRSPAYDWYRNSFYNFNKGIRLVALAQALIAGVVVERRRYRTGPPRSSGTAEPELVGAVP